MVVVPVRTHTIVLSDFAAANIFKVDSMCSPLLLSYIESLPNLTRQQKWKMVEGLLNGDTSALTDAMSSLTDTIKDVRVLYFIAGCACMLLCVCDLVEKAERNRFSSLSKSIEKEK